MRPLPIQTASLALRQFVAEDAAVLHRLNGEASTGRWLPSHMYSDLSHAEAAVAFLIGCYSSTGDARRGPYGPGVAHRRTGESIGHAGFSPVDDLVEVSYAIAEDFRGGFLWRDEESSRFQGTQQEVSRYVWFPHRKT